MVTNHYLDDMEESGHWLQTWRCTNCGNVVDETIRAHHTAGIQRVPNLKKLDMGNEIESMKITCGQP
jgi:hypothetical protein